MPHVTEYLIKYRFKLVTRIRYRVHFSLYEEKNTRLYTTEGVGVGGATRFSR